MITMKKRKEKETEKQKRVEEWREWRSEWRQHEWHNIRGRTVTMRLLIKRPPRLRAQPTHSAIHRHTDTASQAYRQIHRYINTVTEYEKYRQTQQLQTLGVFCSVHGQSR